MVVCHLQDIHFRVVVEDLLGGVRAAFLIKLGVETHVGGDHDHVGLPVDGLDCFLDCGAGGLIGAFLDAGLAAVPDGHIGGDHADDGDLHAIPLGDGPACAGHKIAAGVLDIGCQHGEVGLTEDGLHGRDAPVELMVAKRHGIVAHLVHGGDHRMRLIRPLVGDVVGHDRALNVVTGIHQHHIGLLSPHLLDVGVQACHAVVGGLLVVLVAVAPRIAVHIRGAENGDVRLLVVPRSKSRSREDADRQRSRSNAGDQFAEQISHVNTSSLSSDDLRRFSLEPRLSIHISFTFRKRFTVFYPFFDKSYTFPLPFCSSLPESARHLASGEKLPSPLKRSHPVLPPIAGGQLAERALHR